MSHTWQKSVFLTIGTQSIIRLALCSTREHTNKGVWSELWLSECCRFRLVHNSGLMAALRYVLRSLHAAIVRGLSIASQKLIYGSTAICGIKFVRLPASIEVTSFWSISPPMGRSRLWRHRVNGRRTNCRRRGGRTIGPGGGRCLTSTDRSQPKWRTDVEMARTSEITSETRSNRCNGHYCVERRILSCLRSIEHYICYHGSWNWVLHGFDGCMDVLQANHMATGWMNELEIFSYNWSETFTSTCRRIQCTEWQQATKFYFSRSQNWNFRWLGKYNNRAWLSGMIGLCYFWIDTLSTQHSRLQYNIDLRFNQSCWIWSSKYCREVQQIIRMKTRSEFDRWICEVIKKVSINGRPMCCHSVYMACRGIRISRNFK